MSQYRTGTASVVQDSAVVSGTGTAWLANVSAGDSFVMAGTGVVYDIASVDGDTQLTLTVPYKGADRSGAYAVQRDFTADGIPEMAQGDIETATIFTRAMRKIQSRINQFTGIAGNGAPMFGGVSAGETGTSDGEFFWVYESGTLQLYQNDNGTAAPAGDPWPTSSELQALQDQVNSFEIYTPDPERRAVEAATGGLCTIERTPNGQPCYMYVLSKTRAEDLAPGGELGTGMHEAFVVNGQERSTLLIGMFLAAEVNGELVSQPGRKARTSQNFDTQMAAAQALGADWHQMTIWEWAFVSLWCMANDFEPRGNTNYGRSHSHPFEVAARTDGLAPGDSGLAYTYTGYGPNTWRHNSAANGIADMVGNVWERLNLMKMVDGRVMLASDNDPSLAEADWTDTGWDVPGNGTWAASDNAGASDALKRALVVPNGTLDPGGYLYTNLTGERIPIRGGNRNNGGNAGLGALSLHHERSAARGYVGLRLARLVS